jgi:hypothetical protein
MSDAQAGAAILTPPTSGLIAMRIGIEFGGSDEFVSSVSQALALGGDRGATIVARLDLGDLSVHIPREDGPCWNSVPLLHLHTGWTPSAAEWGAANAILEKLERYR